MAHKILGIDLGSYSVKVTELDAGFRQAKLAAFHEMLLLPKQGEESELQRGTRTLKALLDREKLVPEMCAAGISEPLIVRVVPVPFSDPKKIEQILSYEVESTIVESLEDLVLDHVIGDSKPDRTNVLAIAVPKAVVAERIGAFASVGAEPRRLGASSLSYAALQGIAFESVGTEMIVDIGHLSTQICILRAGTVLFVRTIGRGGEDVTRAMMKDFNVEEGAGTESKHQFGVVLGANAHGATAQERKVDACVRPALRPLVRDLKQTLAAHRATDSLPLERVWLTGGGARLRGMCDFIEAELDTPTALLRIPRDHLFLAPEFQDSPGKLDAFLPAQSLGLALAAAQPAPQINLRKGEFAFRTDYSYLRGKARYLGVSLAAIVIFATINAIASLKSLNKESEALQARMKRETVELFGEARTDGKKVLQELRDGPQGGMPQMPERSAFDLLDDISRAVPAGDKVHLDITELDIRPKKTFVKATADSAEQVETLVEELSKVDCLKDIQKGKLSTVTAPPSGDSSGGKNVELKQFTLTIETCM